MLVIYRRTTDVRIQGVEKSGDGITDLDLGSPTCTPPLAGDPQGS
jgi:hypothetical protein